MSLLTNKLELFNINSFEAKNKKKSKIEEN